MINVSVITEAVPNLPPEIVDQLERVNQDPPIHRYIQLHNAFELVVRYLALASYLRLKCLGRDSKLLSTFEDVLHRPSFDAWRKIFAECSKRLHAQRRLTHSAKEQIQTPAVRRVIEYVHRFSAMTVATRTPSSTGLIDAVINYRNLTRGHGCVIHDGYEEFTRDLGAALTDFLLWWRELMNVERRSEATGVHFVFDGVLVDASMFVRANERNRLIFYNRVERGSKIERAYFLDYDTGIHQLMPDQKEVLNREFQLRPQPYQTSLFPRSNRDIHDSYDARAIDRIKRYLSYEYDATAHFHDRHEEELGFLLGIDQFSEKAKRDGVLNVLLRDLQDQNTDELEDLYYDFAASAWRSLTRREAAAVERDREDMSPVEVAELLASKIAERADGISADVDQLEELEAMLSQIRASLDAASR